MAANEDVYCTLVMNDAYLPGAAVLAHSLRDSGTKRKLACLILQDSLRDSTVEELQSLYNYVIPVDRIRSPNAANLYLMNRPDLLDTFTKIHLWRLTQFRKIVYIDSDVVALRAPEELFDIHEAFAAAPDVGWPDAFNTGVMVLSPNNGDFNALQGLAAAGDSFDGADQGLLNQYFEYRPWRRLSFIYNTTPNANYQYEPAYRYYKRGISMAHFIGSNKPWQRGRSAGGMSGAFQELLGRWWAVWDRHFEVSPTDYIYGQKYPVPPGVQDVFHHTPQINPSSAGYPVATTQPAPPPLHVAEPVLTEPSHPAEDIVQGHVQPAPTVEQRRFSAPHMEWDATRGAPPVDAKPEAVNFPTQTYEFNNTTDLFRPPPSYPDPPKNMWYEVPAKPKEPEILAPIFPWEERNDRKPARKFVDDEPKPQEHSPDLDPAFISEFEVTHEEPLEPKTPTIKLNDEIPWQSFGRNRNAWDEMSGIENYVRQLTAFRKNRGNVQVVQPNDVSPDISPTTAAAAAQAVLSPTAEPDPVDLIDQVQQRRESLILTDFPSAVERPSLPVTPAPRRRTTFWGDEKESKHAASELPPAEGVPHQADWNPAEQLEQLRRSSLIDLKLPHQVGQQPSLPNRAMPVSAQALPEQIPSVSEEPSARNGDLSSVLETGGTDGNALAEQEPPSPKTVIFAGSTDPVATEANTVVDTEPTAATSTPATKVVAVDEAEGKRMRAESEDAEA